MREFLLKNVLPFWMEHSIDYECGGILNAVDREGRVYDTTKNVWFAGRTMYTYSKAYNEFDKNEKYLGVEVIAASTYEGKPVSAKAICRVEDEYDEAQGVRLACARCNEKVALKRKKRAERKLKEAEETFKIEQKKKDIEKEASL